MLLVLGESTLMSNLVRFHLQGELLHLKPLIEAADRLEAAAAEATGNPVTSSSQQRPPAAATAAVAAAPSPAPVPAGGRPSLAPTLPSSSAAVGIESAAEHVAAERAALLASPSGHLR